MSKNEMLPAALDYAARGWSVFPVAAGKKTPRTANGFHDATTDDTAIRLWWEGKPFLNIGVATGSTSGVWALDIDGEPGAASLMDLEQRHGELPDTSVFRTPRGGRQYLFTIPPGVSITSAVAILPGVDVRGDGGYSVFPPSVRPEGPYAWTSTAPVAAPPQWLVDLVTGTRPISPASATDTIVDQLVVQAVTFRDHPGAGEGQRNREAARLAGCELAKGTPAATVLVDAFAWAERCRPAMQLDELRDVLASIATRESAKPEPVAGDDYDPDLEAIELRTPAWPSRPAAMLAHGVVGDLLRRVETETEAEREVSRRRRRRRRGGRREDGGNAGEDALPAVLTAEGEAPADGDEAPADGEAVAGVIPEAAPEGAAVAEGEDDRPRRRRGRRGGRRRRDGEPGLAGEAGSETGEDEAEDAVAMPAPPPRYTGPTPADPFASQVDPIMAAMDAAERAAEEAAFGATRKVEPATPVEAAPVVEVAVAEAPVIEAPVVQAPVIEVPVVQAPVVPEPAVPEPAVPEPVVEVVVEAPAAAPAPAPAPAPAAATPVEPAIGPVIQPLVIGAAEIEAPKKKGWWRR